MSYFTRSDVKSAEVSMVITRADGTVEDLGIVSYYHKNPIKRAIFKIKQYIKSLSHVWLLKNNK